jgi:TM2 domain-containing membrane protein YozV
MPVAPMASLQAPFGIEPMTGLPYSDKSRVVAGVLQICLGWCGAGRFYTGHMAIAILQLCFAWLTCGIWPLVDGIMMLTGRVTDAQGRPLRQS